MKRDKKIVCVIPARLKSTRFPEKVLKSLAHKPMLQWIYEAALASQWFETVVIAVDDKRTEALVESFGGKALMTSTTCPTGTDRLIEVKDRYQIEGDIWVNWQGDEPLIRKPLIDDLLQSIHDGSDIWTLKKACADAERIISPHVVKVVTDSEGKALYFSRCPIPYTREEEGYKGALHFKHVGIYAYTREALDRIAVLKPCDLEREESLEQLRFLYHGLRIRVHETIHDTYGIDLEEHLAVAERQLLATSLA